MSERIIEQNGKRWRFVERRRVRIGDTFVAGDDYDPPDFITALSRNYGIRDIYELIEEKPMLKHVIAGQEKEQPTVIKWGLMTYGDGIMLTATGADGKYWNVLNVQPDGRILRCTSVPESLGLPLNERGGVKLVE